MNTTSQRLRRCESNSSTIPTTDVRAQAARTTRGLSNPMDPILRPLNYVEPEPVIRRVGDRELYLGNVLAADPTLHDWAFDYVLSLTSDEQPLTTDHRPLLDGPENDWPVFERAVETARTRYLQKGSVLVHCKAGISRSSTLIAVTLAAEEDRPFREALDLVHRARPSAMPHPALHELAVIYLAAREG